MNKKYLETINNFQHCQRNWDLTKKVPDKLIDFFFEVGYNVPTKQNLNSFTIVCVKTRENIADWSSIARNSNDTLLHSAGSYISDKVNNGGLQNPQTSANLLFLFFINDSERYSELRKKREGGNDPTSRSWRKDKNIEIGISASAIGIAANQIGMRTGFCGCIWHKAIQHDWVKDWNVRPEDLVLMLGVGYPLLGNHFVENDGKSIKTPYAKAPYKKIII